MVKNSPRKKRSRAEKHRKSQIISSFYQYSNHQYRWNLQLLLWQNLPCGYKSVSFAHSYAQAFSGWYRAQSHSLAVALQKNDESSGS